MGRQIKPMTTDLAYIAGFLDGDGSIIFQLKKRNDTSKGKRLMFTICLYQDSRHEKPLLWMRKVLGIGYVSRRKDGITEVRINGYEQVEKILSWMTPYLKFKQTQAKSILEVLQLLKGRRMSDLSKREKQKIAKLLVTAREQNYQSGQKKMDKLKKGLDDIINW